MVFTLQKLVHLHPDNHDANTDSDGESEKGTKKKSSLSKRLWKSIKKMSIIGNAMDTAHENQRRADAMAGIHDPQNNYVKAHTDGVQHAPVQTLRTLQRYHGGPNQERAAFMEAHSALTKREMAVCAEQVSIFLTTGKTSNCLPKPLTDLTNNIR